MRRTTTRSPRHSPNGARRAASSRSRSTRSKRPKRPHLSPRQVREIAGVLLILAALLGLLAIASNAGSVLAGLRTGLLGAFDRAWFIPVAVALAFGAYLLWPKAPRPRPVDLVSGSVAVVALIGLFGLAGHAGGAIGDGIDRALTSVAGLWGAWALLVAGLVIGLIVTIHFSPGALVTSVVRAGQAGFAERKRLQKLVTPDDLEPRPISKKAAASEAALLRSAASFATPPPLAESAVLWDVDPTSEPEPGQVPALTDGEPEETRGA